MDEIGMDENGMDEHRMDTQVIDQLRLYGEAVEKSIPAQSQTLMRTVRNRRRSLAVLSLAAALAVLVGSVVLLRGGDVEQRVDTPATNRDATNGSTTVPPPTIAPQQLISFDSIGDYRLAQNISADDPQLRYDDELNCGSWDPEAGVTAIVEPSTGSDSSTSWLYVDDPAYRTESGLGIGTDLATLGEEYGQSLVVVRPDDTDTPEAGPWALYQDVAVVRSGNNALTFFLGQDVVTKIKLSTVEHWGDDEGCL